MIPHVGSQGTGDAADRSFPMTINFDPVNPFSGEGGTTLRVNYRLGDDMTSPLKPLLAATPSSSPPPPPSAADLTKTSSSPSPASASAALSAPVALSDASAAELLALLRTVSEMLSQQKVVGGKSNQGASDERTSYPISEVLRQFVEAPAPPREPVVFDLGAGGIHRAYFHHVSIHGSSVFLYYDDRYTEGYRFLPPITPPDQHIFVTFPNRNDLRLPVAVLPLSNTLEYVDIVQLLVLREEPAEAALPFFPPVREQKDNGHLNSSW